MHSNRHLKLLLLCSSLLSVAAFFGCRKAEKGFLSDNIFYRENPLTTTQGAMKVSAPLVGDGSTNPLTVQLVRVSNEKGDDVTTLVTKPFEVLGFSAPVTHLDNTLELLNKKITKTQAKPITVGEVGGRIQLTPATQFIPVGKYSLDLNVSNVRGSRSMPNACRVIISGSGSADTVYGGTYAGTFRESTGGYVASVATPDVQVIYIPGAMNKLVYKFIDKNGNVYNPKANGLTVRKLRWSMKDFDPYYPEVLTDTSAEYQIPVVPNQFPVFQNPGENGIIPRGNYGVFPAIPTSHNDMGYGVFVFLDMAFFKQGTFIITSKFSDVSWK